MYGQISLHREHCSCDPSRKMIKNQSKVWELEDGFLKRELKGPNTRASFSDAARVHWGPPLTLPSPRSDLHLHKLQEKHRAASEQHSTFVTPTRTQTVAMCSPELFFFSREGS